MLVSNALLSILFIARPKTAIDLPDFSPASAIIFNLPRFDAKEVNIGDSGIVFPWIGCGICQACKEGNETLCEAPKYLGARLNGGYSDHIIVPDSKYLVSYGDMDPAVAAPYACAGLTAFSALKKIPDTHSDDWIIIIGAGGVGINGILLSAAVHKAKILADR